MRTTPPRSLPSVSTPRLPERPRASLPARVGAGLADVGDAFEAGLQRAGNALESGAHRVHQAGEALLSRIPAMDLWGRGPSAGKIGWLQRTGAPTRDVTARFDEVYAAAARGQNTLPKEAGEHVYLSIQGLLGKHLPNYMDANEQHLRELGLTVQRVPVDTVASVEHNADIIRQAILEASRSGRQVVLLGHSKGGVDASAALSLYPELKEHVRAVVTMQSPFGGSPIANDLAACEDLGPVVDGFFERLVDGQSEALEDLTYASRQAFLEAHPYPSDIPTLNLGSSSDSPLSLLAKPVLYSRLRYGEGSDGLVAEKDSYLPGAKAVRLTGLDHAGPALPDALGESRWDVGLLTQALVTLALEE